jgi:hypothetical protein
MRIISLISNVILLINVILFFVFLFRKGKPYKVFSFYLLGIFCIQSVTIIMARLSLNNIYISHIYFIFQFISLSYFYLLLMKDKIQKLVVMVGFATVLLTLLIQYLLNFEAVFYKFNLFEVFITSIVLVLFAALHYYNMLSNKKQLMYVNSGVLIYLMASSLLFIAGNYLINASQQLTKWIWIINASMYLIYQLLIFIEWRQTYQIAKLR